MELKLRDKVALVCGASSGIGYAVATELTREGTTTIICSSHEERINHAAWKIRQETGRDVHPFKADLSVSSQIDALADLSLSKFGSVDVLINNTGGPRAGYFLDFTEEDWNSAFKLTLSSAVHFTKLLLPNMVEQRWGRIINLTSVTVKQPIDNLILSNSIRLAVIGWAKTISNQYATYGITINNIATGYTLTERVKNLAGSVARQKGITPDQAIATWLQAIPAGRLAQPEEIAYLVTFLASEKASYITGVTIPVDGGFIQSMI